MGEVEIRTATTVDLQGAASCMREVLEGDLGGYRERWHRDIDDLAETYVKEPRAVLLVAVEVLGDGERVLATTAVRPCRLASPPNPEWLAERYSQDEVCQLVRVWVRPEARRRGLARQLVGSAARWATEQAGYQTVYLHTDASVPGAESFWRSMPTVEVYDARPDPYHTVHFEIEVAKIAAGSGLSGKQA